MHLSRAKKFYASGTALAFLAAAAPVAAQDQGTNDATPNGEIVVTATRIKGSVETDVPPIQEIDEKDIAAYGASSLTDLIVAVAPQVGSGRGRGGGMPVILLNGQRISGFRELRDLPPEVIKRVQIFPEEVALKYGYKPDQRVINFILKDNFASFSAELEGGVPQAGGYSRRQVESTLTRIGKDSRLVIGTAYETRNRLTENERGIAANPATTVFTRADGSTDIGEFRTLLSDTERFEVNTTWTKSLAPQSTLSVNGNYKLEGSRGLLGLPSASLLVPGNSPFSRTGTDVILNRYFSTPRALARNGTTGSAQFAASYNRLVGPWRLALTGDFASVDTHIVSTRNADFAALRAAILAGTANPYAAGLGSDLSFLPADQTDSLSHVFNALGTLSGALFRVPAGEVQMTLRGGFTRQTLDSIAQRNGLSSASTLQRNDANGAISLDIPLIERGVGALGFLGDISLNGNYGRSQLSDFGGLTAYGTGLRWSPVKSLTFLASLIGDENAPGIAQLGSPNLATPNVAYYDFTTGQSVFITALSGGNPALAGEKRRDIKLSLSYSPPKVQGLNLQIEYFKNESRNTTAAFPLLTPEIEAAFPGRVTRDANGRLTNLDQRPVNFDRERSQSIRTGFNMSGSIGKQPQGGMFGGGFGGGGARPQGGGQGGLAPSATTQRPSPVPPRNDGPRSDGPRTSGPRSGGPGGFGGGFGLPGGGQPPSRWQASLTHTYRIQQDILIRPGVPVLDLLNGSAISNLGGAPRHEVELSGGVFVKGIGLRVTGNYRSATTAKGTGLPGSSDLRFSDLKTLDLRLFIALDNRGNLTKKLPFLKGSRIAFEVQNVLNDIIDVRDQNGTVPFSYQPGYLDPKGRLFELSFRRRF